VLFHSVARNRHRVRENQPASGTANNRTAHTQALAVSLATTITYKLLSPAPAH